MNLFFSKMIFVACILSVSGCSKQADDSVANGKEVSSRHRYDRSLENNEYVSALSSDKKILVWDEKKGVTFSDVSNDMEKILISSDEKELFGDAVAVLSIKELYVEKSLPEPPEHGYREYFILQAVREMGGKTPKDIDEWIHKEKIIADYFLLNSYTFPSYDNDFDEDRLKFVFQYINRFDQDAAAALRRMLDEVKVESKASGKKVTASELNKHFYKLLGGKSIAWVKDTYL